MSRRERRTVIEFITLIVVMSTVVVSAMFVFYDRTFDHPEYEIVYLDGSTP